MAEEDGCQGAHNQLISLMMPAKHTMFDGYTCTFMYVHCMYRVPTYDIYVCTLYVHVHIHHRSVCTPKRQKITEILDCVCRQWSMTMNDGKRIPDSHGTFKLRSGRAAHSTSYWSGGTGSDAECPLSSFNKVS